MELMESLNNIYLRKFVSDKGFLLVEMVRVLETKSGLATIITARQYNSPQNKYSHKNSLINYGYSANQESTACLEDLVSLKDVFKYGALVQDSIFDIKNGVVISKDNEDVIVASSDHVYSAMTEKEKNLYDFFIKFNNVISASERKSAEKEKVEILKQIVVNTQLLNDEKMFNVIKETYEHQYSLNHDAKELEQYKKENSSFYKTLLTYLSNNKGPNIINDIETIFTQFSPDVLIDSLIPKTERANNILIDYNPDDELSVYRIPVEHKRLIIIENARLFLNYDTKSTIKSTEKTIEATYLALLKLAKNLKIIPDFAISLGDLDPHNEEWKEKTKNMN